MEAVLKGLYSSDVADVESYQPEKEDNFGFVGVNPSSRVIKCLMSHSNQRLSILHL
jgi:hypothetical protein